MFDHLMEHIAEQKLTPSGAVDRPEFERDYGSHDAVNPSDPDQRQKLERFVLANTPERHRYMTAEGLQAIVYFDARGRAASSTLAEISTEELVRIAHEFSSRFPGEPDHSRPGTSSTDHGYRKPVTEERGRFSAHKPAEADNHLGEAYNALLAIKGDMDKMEEVPQPLRAFYKQVEKAMGSVAEARKETTQLRGMAKRLA